VAQPAMSPSAVSSMLKNSGSNDSLLQAQGLSLPKAAGTGLTLRVGKNKTTHMKFYIQNYRIATKALRHKGMIRILILEPWSLGVFVAE